MTEEGQFPCSQCGEVCDSAEDLYYHMIDEHDYKP